MLGFVVVFPLGTDYNYGSRKLHSGYSVTERELRAKAYRDAETNFLLSGLDSSGDADYQAMKERVISGEIDIDEAIGQTVARYKALARAMNAKDALTRKQVPEQGRNTGVLHCVQDDE